MIEDQKCVGQNPALRQLLKIRYRCGSNKSMRSFRMRLRIPSSPVAFLEIDPRIVDCILWMVIFPCMVALRVIWWCFNIEKVNCWRGRENRLIRIFALAFGHDLGTQGRWLYNAGIHASCGVLF